MGYYSQTLGRGRPQPGTIAPKPLHRPKLPARKPNRMTIAIGMLCEGGLVVAADTQMTWENGTTCDAVKIQSLTTPTSVFAVAYSCVDMNAAETLVSELTADLKMVSPRSLLGVEETIKNRMAQWAASYTVSGDRPRLEMVLGARINSTPSIPCEFGLYLCEPPGSVVRRTHENSSGYVAAGAGMGITDPLFRTLFGQQVSPRVCLGQLSYLMYRAKKDCRGACGGGTDAVLITEEHADPLWIEKPLMKQAEVRGRLLDETLAKVASAVMSRRKMDDVSGFTGIFDVYQNHLANLFRARTGEVIR
jgi:hypothetical protein